MGIETALLIGGTIASVGGSLYEGRQRSKAAEYNARVAEQQAQATRQKAEYDENIHRERVRRLLSSQRAAYGGSGVEATGSPLLAIEDTAAQGELDALAIRYGGEVGAARSLSEAEQFRQQGKTARTSSFFKAGTSLLSGGRKSYRSFKAGK